MNTSTYEEKILWVIEYINPYHHPQNWLCIFDTREAAIELLEEQIGWYQSQGAIITREDHIDDEDTDEPGPCYTFVYLTLKEEEDPIGIMKVTPYYLNCGDRPLWIL
jgi:hypothetical protein